MFPSQNVDYFLIVNVSPFLLSLMFVSIISLTLFNHKEILKIFKKINNKTWFLLFLVFVVSCYIRFFRVPHVHRWYDDEFQYMLIAKHITLQFQSKTCSGICHTPRTLALGFPFILAIPFFLFRIDSMIAINTTVVLSVLTIPLIFLISYLIFKNEEISLYASLLFSMVPSIGLWSTTTEPNVPSVFFLALSLFYFLSYFHNQKFKILVLAVITLAFTMYMRHENILILPILFFMFLVLDVDRERFRSMKFWMLSIIFLALISIDVIQFLTSTETGLFVISTVLRNFNEWFLPFMLGEYHSTIFSLLILIGLIFSKKDKSLLIMIIWLIPWFILCLFNPDGEEHRLNRFAVPVYITLSLIGGFGFFSLTRLIENNLLKIFILLIVIFFLFSSFFSYVESHTPQEFIIETKLSLMAKEKIPKNCYVIAAYPSVISATTDLKTIMTEQFVHTDTIEESFYESDCILFFKDIHCEVDLFGFKEDCNFVLNNYELSPFLIYPSGDYGFYKLQPREK